jgi:nicotinamide-nucleotide amidase
MEAEIIAIGDELVSGQRLNTNSQWLSQRLGEIGIAARWHTTVGDDLEACTDVFRVALQRARLVVATGGLGPTADDLTRQAICAVTNRELVLDESSLAHIRHLFESRGRRMPEANRIQAMFPWGCDVIPNPHGTAPGIDLSVDNPPTCSRVVALPGVPAEMIEMWNDTVRERIRSTPGVESKVIAHRCIKCFGVGESECEQMLPDLIRRGQTPSVGITVHRGTITLRVTAKALSIPECHSIMQPTIETIRDCLGRIVFGQDDDELQDVLIRLLEQRSETVAVCEWGTAGTMANWLASSDATGRVFQGGLVVRSLATLSSLGIERALTSDLTDKELACQMAQVAREKLGTTYGLSTSKFPARLGEGTYSYAIATPTGLCSKSRLYAAHPDIALDLAAKHAINHLRLHLELGS